MASAGVSGGSSGKRALAVVVAVIGILAIVAGILYLTGVANSLHFMVGAVHTGHHLARAGLALVVGIVLLVIAWLTGRRN